jgi:hypothetical protein
MSNRNGRAAFLFLITCTGAAWAQQAVEPPVAVRTDGLPPHVAARVTEKARQGITELRRYVWISRGVNQLDLRSLQRVERSAQLAASDRPPTLVALDAQR